MASYRFIPKTSVLATNVSLSHTSLVGIVLKKRNNFKDQFYIIIFCSTEMNYSDFIFVCNQNIWFSNLINESFAVV